MLGKGFRRMYSELKSVRESRADTCYSYTSKILSNLLGALFIRKRFSSDVKSDVSIQFYSSKVQFYIVYSSRIKRDVKKLL